MARRRQSSSNFNVAGFDGVEMSVDLGEAIDRWRDEFLRTVGMNDRNRGMAKYRRAAGWAVDEVAKTAVQNIRYRFYRTMKKHVGWTNSAVAYKRLSKADLNGLERGERNVEDIYAQVFVKPNQSAYLKYLSRSGTSHASRRGTGSGSGASSWASMPAGSARARTTSSCRTAGSEPASTLSSRLSEWRA